MSNATKNEEQDEARERDALTMQIAKAIAPAVAWDDPFISTDLEKRRPAEPFASMPIDALRAFVARLKAAGLPRLAPRPPYTTN